MFRLVRRQDRLYVCRRSYTAAVTLVRDWSFLAFPWSARCLNIQSRRCLQYVYGLRQAEVPLSVQDRVRATARLSSYSTHLTQVQWRNQVVDVSCCNLLFLSFLPVWSLRPWTGFIDVLNSSDLSRPSYKHEVHHWHRRVSVDEWMAGS